MKSLVILPGAPLVDACRNNSASHPTPDQGCQGLVDVVRALTPTARVTLLSISNRSSAEDLADNFCAVTLNGAAPDSLSLDQALIRARCTHLLLLDPQLSMVRNLPRAKWPVLVVLPGWLAGRYSLRDRLRCLWTHRQVLWALRRQRVAHVMHGDEAGRMVPLRASVGAVFTWADLLSHFLIDPRNSTGWTQASSAARLFFFPRLPMAKG